MAGIKKTTDPVLTTFRLDRDYRDQIPEPRAEWIRDTVKARIESIRDGIDIFSEYVYSGCTKEEDEDANHGTKRIPQNRRV